MLKFNLQKYSDIGIAMHCPTGESVEIFLKYLHNNGRTWVDGSCYLGSADHLEYGESTCYLFNKGTICDFEHLSNNPNSYYILNFYDFDWGEGISKNYFKTSEMLDNFLNDFRVVT